MTLMQRSDALVLGDADPNQAFEFAVQARRSSPGRIAVTSIVIACLTLLLLLARINKPNGLLIDEGIYVGIAQSLLKGTLGPMPREFSAASQGRQHPPMGPYLIATGIKVAGDNALGWRLASVVCGVLTVVALFLWTYLLLRDYWLAVTAASLTLFNCFLYVMSRTAMLDVFVFMFTIWAVLVFTMAVELEVSQGARRGLILASGLLFGLGGACKWNAVDTLAGVLAVASVGLCCGKYIALQNPRLRRSAENLRTIGFPTLALALIVVPALSYGITFVPVFHAMHTPLSLGTLVRMHSLMFTLTKAAPGIPTQYAPWYSWPFRLSPIREFSFLLGNPVVMWGGLLALAVCGRRLLKYIALPEGMVVCLYAANLLQWAVTPLKVPNYYYYYSAAMLLGIAIAVALDYPTRQRIFGVRPSLVVVLAASVVFLYCYPRMAYLEAPWDCMFGCWN